MKKTATKAEREHMAKVAGLGCIACLNLSFPDSPASIHHITTGIGMGQRASHYQTIPLCPEHHQHGGVGVAIHASKSLWEGVYGTELQLLEQVRGML